MEELNLLPGWLFRDSNWLPDFVPQLEEDRFGLGGSILFSIFFRSDGTYAEGSACGNKMGFSFVLARKQA